LLDVALGWGSIGRLIGASLAAPSRAMKSSSSKVTTERNQMFSIAGRAAHAQV